MAAQTRPAQHGNRKRATSAATPTDSPPCPDFSRTTRAECFADLVATMTSSGQVVGPADLLSLEAMSQVLYRMRRYGGCPSVGDGKITAEEKLFQASLRELRLLSDHNGLSVKSRRSLELTGRDAEQQADLSRLRLA